MAVLSKTKSAHRVDQLDTMIPYLFALGCARVWMTLTFAAPLHAANVPFDPHTVFDYGYAVVGVSVGLLARRIAPLQEQRWSKPFALTAMVVSSACMLIASAVPVWAAALSAVGSVMGAAGFCLTLLLVTEALVPLSLIRIALYTAASRFIAVPLVLLCEGLDEIRLGIVIAALPFIAIGCATLAYRSTSEADRPTGAYPKFTFPWKPVALYAIYSFVYGLREHQLAAGAGMHSSISTALIMGVFFLVVYFFSGRFSVSALYRSPMLLMVCGLLLVPAEGLLGTAASSYLISMSYTLMSLLISLLLYDLSKRLGIAIIAVSGIMKAVTLFTVWGADCANLLAASPLSDQAQNIVIMVAVVMLVLAGSLILLSEKELASKWGIRLLDTNDLVEDGLRTERVSERCSAITKRYHLSPREDEIFRLLAQGKANRAIEEELFIASGTLKAHVQHIYVKIGIHSRKELAELVGEDEDVFTRR